MQRILTCVLALFLAGASVGLAQKDQDGEGVRQAVLDYVEGIYEVNPGRIERSVHPDMAKRGFARKQEGDGYDYLEMNFQQLVDLSRRYNADRRLAPDAPKEVVVLELLDQTATAKLTAVWGVDYLHLAKFDGRWKIINVLWQTLPKKP